jgi:hypothetical protein
MANGKYQRSGPEKVFVSPESATGLRNIVDPSSTIQINANHSEMVKFSQGNELINLIASRLQDVLSGNISGITKGREGANNTVAEKTTALHEHSQWAQNQAELVDVSLDQEFWNIYCETMAPFPIQRTILTF